MRLKRLLFSPVDETAALSVVERLVALAKLPLLLVLSELALLMPRTCLVGVRTG